MIIPVVAVLIIRAPATKNQAHRAARRNESFFLPPYQRRRDTLACKQCRHAVYNAFIHTNQISSAQLLVSIIEIRENLAEISFMPSKCFGNHLRSDAGLALGKHKANELVR